jgi:hypothetical protein
LSTTQYNEVACGFYQTLTEKWRAIQSFRGRERLGSLQGVTPARLMLIGVRARLIGVTLRRVLGQPVTHRVGGLAEALKSPRSSFAARPPGPACQRPGSIEGRAMIFGF